MRHSRLILDHVSVAYGADETIDIYEANDVTVQWCTIEASQLAPNNPEPNHNYGIIQGPDARRISFHHNLCANHSRRCPAIANGPAAPELKLPSSSEYPMSDWNCAMSL